MVRGRLETVAAEFQLESEELRRRYLSMTSDIACIECSTARLGEAILCAWLQTKWSDFTRKLVTASAQGTRRRQGNVVPPVPRVRSREDAEGIVKTASLCIMRKRGLGSPVWHAPWFAIDVGKRIGLRNLDTLELSLGSSVVPSQITDFRNYLFHPGERTRRKYEELRQKLGFVRVEPENLLGQSMGQGEMVFTFWVNELQRIANASVR